MKDIARLDKSEAEDLVLPQVAPPTVSQKAILEPIWRGRWIVLLMMALAVGGAFVYLAQAKKFYTSTARIYVTQSGPAILSDAQGMATSRYEAFLNTQVAIFTANPILKSAMARCNAADMPTFSNITKKDDIWMVVMGNLVIGVGKKDDLISVSYDSPHRKDAAQIVQAVVDSYIEFQSKQKESTTKRVLKLLADQREKLNNDLAEQYKKLLDFQRANPALSFESDRGNIILQRASKLSDALTTAQMELLEATALHEAGKILMQDPNMVKYIIEDGHSLNETVTQSELDRQQLIHLHELENQLVEKKLQQTSDHTALKTLQQEIKILQERLTRGQKEDVEAYLRLLAQKVETTKKKVDQLQSQSDAMRNETFDLNVKSTEYARMQAATARLERLVDLVDNRIKELAITEDSGAMNVTLIDPALVPQFPSKPQKGKTMALALAGGLLIGCGLALLRDWLDQRLRSLEEVRNSVGAPILGGVPHMLSNKQHHERAQTVHLEPRSNTAEAYRTIRTAIYFGAPNGQARTILVTSPTPGDGKSTLSSNLSIAMAQAGQRILLVDADFRKPTQHKNFEIKDAVGLASVLEGKATLEQAIHKTAIDRLEVLPCGPLPPNPSEILNSQEFLNIVKQLQETYDTIIFDAPPVLPVADARILGAMVDVTVLVLRLEKSGRKAAEHAMGDLVSVGAKVLGCVVNDIPTRKSGYGYYGGSSYYRYGYGYGYGGYGYGQTYGQGPDKGAKPAKASGIPLSAASRSSHSPTNGGK